MPFKTFTLQIDEQFDRTLEDLRKRLGASSKADVVRWAVAVLRVAEDARDKFDLRLVLADARDQVKKELVLPHHIHPEPQEEPATEGAIGS